MAAPKIEKLLTPYNFTNKDNAGRIKYLEEQRQIVSIMQVSILEHQHTTL